LLQCCSSEFGLHILVKLGFPCCSISFVLVMYKRMPQHWIYIQSLSRVLSAGSIVESGCVYQQCFSDVEKFLEYYLMIFLQ
jgi:hypothetical protein